MRLCNSRILGVLVGFPSWGRAKEGWPASPLLLYIRGRGHPIDTQVEQVDLFQPCAVPPSTVSHLGYIVAVLRRSPASVASSSPSSRRRADGTLPRSSAGSEVPYVPYLIARNEKKFDYINRIVKRFRIWSTSVCGRHSPLLLLCITVILRVHRNFFEITAFPNSGIRAKFMHRCYMHE